MANLVSFSSRVKRNNDIKEAADFIKGVCHKLITKRKEEKQPDHQRLDILEAAMTSFEFSSEDLVNNMMTFLLAGHETTASAFQWCLYMLCERPDVQARLAAELQSSVPSPTDANSTVTADDIDQLPYLKAFCSEILRVYPPVPLTPRVADRDTTLLDQFIPKDTRIFIVPWAINTSKELWGPDAKEFKPERWLDVVVEGGKEKVKANQNGGADSAYSFMTFLHGPRSCIGQAFARAELTLMVAAWVRAFDTKYVEEGYKMELQGGVTVKPKGLRVRVTVRE